MTAAKTTKPWYPSVSNPLADFEEILLGQVELRFETTDHYQDGVKRSSDTDVELLTDVVGVKIPRDAVYRFSDDDFPDEFIGFKDGEKLVFTRRGVKFVENSPITVLYDVEVTL